MFGFRQSFKNSEVDLDRKIWQFAHLWCWSSGKILEVAEHREAFRNFLRLLAPPAYHEKKLVWKWMNV